MRLVAISAHVPDGRIEAEEIVRAAGGSRSQAQVFSRLFGINQVSTAADGTSPTGAFEAVLDSLLQKHEGLAPDAAIYVHALPLQYPEGSSPLSELPDHPLLADVRTRYEVDQYNCGGMFWALEMAESLLRSGLSRCVLLLAGDGHRGLPLSERYVPGCTLMGEAYYGLIVDNEHGGWRFAPIALHMRPEFHSGRAGTHSEMSAFFAAHNGMVKAALDETRFDWSGSSRLLPHNVNQLVWKQMSQNHDLAFDRVDLGLLPDIGHCYTADPFVLLSNLLAKAPDRQDPLTLVSVGMGAFIGAFQLHRSMNGVWQ
ncbi:MULTISPECIES: hypothetical protein [unclassified Mesorhizobium]|uniref:hypothetical protein n=1 Tax=unclassified Mesorhizobium TaxID=325217 RepID=UPI003338D634